jgi:hypothetical protein
MAYEHKPGSGTIFKNKDYDPSAGEDNENKDTNYWGNMTLNVEGKIWKGRLYPKKPKDPSGVPYMRVSLYEPKDPKPKDDELPF